MGLDREAKKRESGGIESEGISEAVLGIPGSETVISGILRFHLNSSVLTFCIMSPSCVNYVEFMFYAAYKNSCVLLFRHREHLGGI